MGRPAPRASAPGVVTLASVTLASVTLAAATLAAVTGCSDASAGSTPPAPLTAAAKAIRLAVSRSAQVSSLTARISIDSSGTTADTYAGTVRMQLKPTTLVEEISTVTDAHSKVVRLTEVMSGDAIYFQNAAFTKATGKPWAKIDLTNVSSKSRLAYAAVFQNFENSNPLDQARLFASSTDVHVVGSPLVHGVLTTEYAGSFTAPAAVAKLPPGLRKRFGLLLEQLGKSPVRFALWVDGQHLIRKAQETLTVGKRTTTTTFDVTSVNQPVGIKLPAPGQVAPLPSG